MPGQELLKGIIESKFLGYVVFLVYEDDRVRVCRDGKAPVKIVDAGSYAEYDYDAYDIGNNKSPVDPEKDIVILQLSINNLSFEFLVTAPKQEKDLN